MAFANLTAKLNLNIADFSSKLASASGKMNDFAKKLNTDYKQANAALNKHNLGLKDTARIVQGIVISQTFYQIVNAISSATSALADFNEQLDYARVTYTALFGDAKLSESFVKALQEHSVSTIFEYQDLDKVAKKMLAYGLEYKNLMYIMEGLTNLGAMSGDAAALDRIALALGQIQSTGYLAATEMRQLANAYVPIYDIVQDSFGLTGEQMANVGALRLPAEDVINAIVDYANEKFGSVGDAAMMTITGLKNRIIDTIKVLGSEMTAPLTAAWKSFLTYIANGLDGIRDAYASGGIGGVFESLVPDKATQKLIRQFLANVHNLFMSVASIGVVVAKVFGNFAHTFAVAFNIVSPMIIGFANALSSVINAMLSTSIGAGALRVALLAAAGAFVVMRVQAMAALVITAVTKAVAGLAKMLVLLASIISKHPLLSIIAGIAAALVGIAAASKTANYATSGLFDTLSGIGGLSSGDVLKKTKGDLEDAGNAAEAFNNRLGDGTSAAEDLADGINGVGDAAKKAKKTGDLLSFDEVFKLTEPASASSGSGSGSGGIGDGVLEDIGGLMDGLGALGGDFLPDIADFPEYINSFTDGLFGAFSKLKSAPNTLAGILAGITGVIGKYLAKSGAAGLTSLVKNAFGTGGIKAVFTSLAGVIKSTGIKAIAKGGLIGAAVGFVADLLASTLWSTIAENLNLSAEATGNAAIGQTIGSIIGTIVGGIFGGPVGAMIGSVLGTFAGGFVGLFWEKIEEYFDPENNVLSAFIVKTAAGLADWWIGTKGGFTDWWQSTIGGFSAWWEETLSGLRDWWTNTVQIFSDWDSINSETLGNWWRDTKQGFTDWWLSTKQRFAEWVFDTASSLVGWVGNTGQRFEQWRTDVHNTILLWAADTLRPIIEWFTNTYNRISDWVGEMRAKFNQFKAEAITVIVGFTLAALESFLAWCRDVRNAVGEWFGGLVVDIKDWWGGLWDTDKWSSGWSHVKSWFSDLLSDIGSWFNSKKDSVKNWWSGLWDGLSTPSVTPTGSSGGRVSMAGHAAGGIFDREHIARFAEGNKAEAIIPLENNSAMQPFVDAVSTGIVGSLAPVLAGNSGGNQLPPLYVGTLIADDRGIKELYRRFEVIQLQEDARRGITR